MVTGVFWLPVVWIQIRLRDLAPGCGSRWRAAAGSDYRRLFRIWFAFGLPAFAAVLAILWLMLARPSFRLI